MLVAGGANLTLQDRKGNTPKDEALTADDAELADYLHSKFIYPKDKSFY